MRLRPSLLIPLLAVALTACSGTAAPPSAAPSAAAGEIQVYAAASLRAVLARARAAYEAANPGTVVTVSTDSSAALETRIEQGAPADVFLSADMENPRKLVDGGFASGDVTAFAGNLLTVIVPTSNPAGITTPADLAGDGVRIIAAADGVPIQAYTATLLENLARAPGYPADMVERYAANVVSREDNAGAVVTKVALGEGDAGVVYMTDATTSEAVTTVEIPAEANVLATYGGVVVKASKSPGAAAAFLAWLAGPDGQAILTSFGFQPAS